jgi:hypothetical protein
MRWTGRETFSRILAESDWFELRVTAQPHNSRGPDGLRVDLLLDGETLDVVHFFNGGSRSLSYYIPGIKGEYVEIRTKVDKTFCPMRAGINEDPRNLGVALSPITFLEGRPGEAIGIYAIETLEQPPVGWPEEKPMRFRWTRKRASLPVEKQWPHLDNGRAAQGSRDETGAMQVFLHCSHPAISKKPVLVRILGDNLPAKGRYQHNALYRGGRVLREVALDSQDWEKIKLSRKDLKKGKVITFAVSRTWNPKSLGISNDPRDLGVAVAIP